LGILLLRANQDVSEKVNLAEMAGQDERRTVHLSDYRRAFEHVVREQPRALVEFRGERAPLRPNRSFALERGLRVGTAFGHASGFELAAFLLRDRAQVHKFVLSVKVEGEEAEMDFVERLAHELESAALEFGQVHRDRHLEALSV